jgi:hypothetical protein
MRYGICNWVFGDENLATVAAFLAEVGSGVYLLNAYPMNIEEADPVLAVLDVGERLFLLLHS